MDNDSNQNPQTKIKYKWYGRIESKAQAEKIIKDISNAFFLVAALQVVVGYFSLGPTTIVDGIIFAVLAALLRRYKNFAVAVILLFISLASIVTTLLSRLGYLERGGKNIFLALIIAWISVRAVQAAVMLKKPVNLKSASDSDG